MKVKEVENYFGNVRQFSVKTGFSRNNIYYWRKIGYVPLSMQLFLEEFTDGVLKTNIDDLPRLKPAK